MFRSSIFILLKDQGSIPSHAVSASNTSRPWGDLVGLIQNNLIEVKESQNMELSTGVSAWVTANV
jgi:hypothetical protein